MEDYLPQSGDFILIDPEQYLNFAPVVGFAAH
jgi:hypothetical protein